MGEKQTLDKSNVMIVTGLSGAGISSSLKSLEDIGFEVFDNFPLSLVEPLLEDHQSKDRPVAFGVDTRTRGFEPDAVLSVVQKVEADLLYITCDDGVLQKRFTETRRRHPMAGGESVKAGIVKERDFLAPLTEKADLTIDTSALSIHDLKHMLKSYFDLAPESKLTVTLMSFGFKHGLPRGADIVMDVRFLRNPYWSPALRDKTGKDCEIGAFIEQDDGFKPFVDSFKSLLTTLLPRYAEEGKSYLTIAIGCTGGQHRSVYTVEDLKSWLDGEGFTPHIDHRDLKD